MGKIYLGTIDGEELHPLCEIKDSELSLGKDEEMRNFIKRPRTSTFTLKCEITGPEGLNSERFFKSGMDQGTYNSMTLKEEGYLSPENGWIKEEKDGKQ